MINKLYCKYCFCRKYFGWLSSDQFYIECVSVCLVGICECVYMRVQWCLCVCVHVCTQGMPTFAVI